METVFIVTITPLEMYIIFALRAFGFLFALFAIALVIRELVRPTPFFWTKILLLVVGACFLIGTVIPLFQTFCFITKSCEVNGFIVPSAIIAAANAFIGSLFFLIIYITKEQEAHQLKEDLTKVVKRQ